MRSLFIDAEPARPTDASHIAAGGSPPLPSHTDYHQVDLLSLPTQQTSLSCGGAGEAVYLLSAAGCQLLTTALSRDCNASVQRRGHPAASVGKRFSNIC